MTSGSGIGRDIPRTWSAISGMLHRFSWFCGQCKYTRQVDAICFTCRLVADDGDARPTRFLAKTSDTEPYIEPVCSLCKHGFAGKPMSPLCEKCTTPCVVPTYFESAKGLTEDHVKANFAKVHRALLADTRIRDECSEAEDSDVAHPDVIHEGTIN